ncbi:MAG: site-specific DNA-methyltransferase [Myxococcota bacterium]
MNPYYEKDGITIYHGDALAVMSALPGDSVGVVATDPPYSSGARNSAALRARKGMTRTTKDEDGRWFGTDNLSSHGFAMLVRMFGVEAYRVTKRDGHLLSFIDWRQWPVLAGAIESSGWSLRSCLVWDKVHYGMGNGFRQQCEFVFHASKGTGDNFLRHDLGTVFRESRGRTTEHPTEKPRSALTDMISALPGDVILDPFMGSGTTLRAAKDLGRKAIGIEIEERYCEIAAKRLAQQVFDMEPGA